MQVVGNAVAYVLLYVVLMVPTYVLPWLGSNSSLLNVAAASSAEGFNPMFWAHAACIALLVGLAWIRGSLIGHPWLVVLPVLAGVFDLAPFLNWVPLVTTGLHLVAIVLGVALGRPAAVGAPVGGRPTASS